ncbi:hypothetical protein NMY22_g19535 [Coprinellus aureogranulatus]|nr:hypothetical protein NMY22_g19535 [Coprinellus aureogranulatus]
MEPAAQGNGTHGDRVAVAFSDATEFTGFASDLDHNVVLSPAFTLWMACRRGDQCMTMDETLYGISEKVQNFAVIYLVDITEVPDFNKMYELYDPCTVMFFYRNKHIMIDLGTGNNNKINWAMDNKQEYPAHHLGGSAVTRKASSSSRSSSQLSIRSPYPRPHPFLRTPQAETLRFGDSDFVPRGAKTSQYPPASDA